MLQKSESTGFWRIGGEELLEGPENIELIQSLHHDNISHIVINHVFFSLTEMQIYKRDVQKTGAISISHRSKIDPHRQ